MQEFTNKSRRKTSPLSDDDEIQVLTRGGAKNLYTPEKMKVSELKAELGGIRVATMSFDNAAMTDLGNNAVTMIPAVPGKTILPLSATVKYIFAGGGLSSNVKLYIRTKTQNTLFAELFEASKYDSNPGDWYGNFLQQEGGLRENDDMQVQAAGGLTGDGSMEITIQYILI